MHNIIQVKDSVVFLQEQDDFSVDIIFCDPPYALGSEIIIREDGKPDYKKARDFMNKWDMPTAEYWERFFEEAFRVLKYGGYILMYGVDRQNFLFKYYAHSAGLQGRQSLYWYSIQNFPKATDLSKKIDAYYKTGKANTISQRISEMSKEGKKVKRKQPNNGLMGEIVEREINVESVPLTSLAKKYDGYKYSIAPLKQVVEEIMVFQKPYKTGSCLHDTLAYENGDATCCCGALNIEGNRVGKREKPQRVGVKKPKSESNVICYGDYNYSGGDLLPDGRYPAQAFIDDGVADILDKQGDCSKILHRCNYEQDEFDIFNYNPKVSSKERNAGLDDFENKILHRVNSGGLEKEERWKPIEVKNNHPTVKPISLNEKILKLFKTPNPQTILIPFAGSGSEIIGAIKAGFGIIQGCEINPEYVKIAKARIEYWRSNDSG